MGDWRDDDRAATSTMGTLMLIFVSATIVGLAAADLRSPTTADLAPRLVLAAVAGQDADTIELIHQGEQALDPDQLYALVWTVDAVHYEGPLGAPGHPWEPGDPFALRMSVPIPPGLPVEVLVRDTDTHAIIAMARLQIPSSPSAAGPLVGFSIAATLDDSITPPDLLPSSVFRVEATVTHPAGRKALRYVYADTSTIDGPTWGGLNDDGTEGDRFASDGIYGGNLQVPGTAPLGTHTIWAHAVDLEGNRVDVAADLNIVSGGLMYILNPAAAKAVQTSGSGCIRLEGDIYVRSTAANSIYKSGSGCAAYPPYGFVATDNGVIYTAGGFSAGCCSPAPVTSSAAIVDPLAAVLMPSYVSGAWYVEGQPQPARTLPPLGTPLRPGVYANGITFVGDSWTMEPGIYIVDGEKFSLSGSAALSGTGVFIYITNHSGSCKGMTVSGDGVVDLTAPTSGPYAGIVIAQDRACTTVGTLSGGSGLHVTGAVYMPAAKLTLSGGSAMTTLEAMLVTDTLSISGGGFTLVRP